MQLRICLLIGWLAVAMAPRGAVADVIEARVSSGSHPRLETPLKVPIDADFLGIKLRPLMR